MGQVGRRSGSGEVGDLGVGRWEIRGQGGSRSGAGR